MLEVASGSLALVAEKRFAQYLYQSALRAGSCLAQHTLDLGERFFYRVEVRRIGGQVDELAAPRLDQLPHLGRFVGRERLSMITTCPASKVGAKTCST